MVEVGILQTAHTSVRLTRGFCLLAVLEESIYNVAHDRAVRLLRLHEVLLHCVCIRAGCGRRQIRHFVAEEVDVGSHVVAQTILRDVAVAHACLHTHVAKRRTVRPCGTALAHCSEECRRDKHVLYILNICINRSVELLVEQREVGTNVILYCCLPLQVVVRGLSCAET